MSVETDMFRLDILDYFAATGETINLSFTLDGRLKDVQCSIVSYDPSWSFVIVRPLTHKKENWIIPLKNIELMKSQAL